MPGIVNRRNCIISAKRSSRGLAVLEERQRSLLSAQSSVLADKNRPRMRNRSHGNAWRKRSRKLLVYRLNMKKRRNNLPLPNRLCKPNRLNAVLWKRQLRAARAEIEKWSAQRAESQARLDELKSRLENLQSRLENANKAIESAEGNAHQAEEKHTQASQAREQAESRLREAEAELREKRQQVERLENERRNQAEERAQQLAQHSRLKAQLEVLEQAEHSLAGYAEGARFLLDAARQLRLKSARGALSASLDVPAELEVAVAAALGDTLDAILLDAGEIDEALQLLESDGAGRAALLPLENHSRPPLTNPTDENSLGVASELIHAPEELRGAVHLVLGQTLIVRDRATARRLLKDLPTHARVVTLRGEVFRGDGLIIAGKSASTSGSALSRPRQKRELTESLAVLGTQIESLNREVDSLSAQITDCSTRVATG